MGVVVASEQIENESRKCTNNTKIKRKHLRTVSMCQMSTMWRGKVPRRDLDVTTICQEEGIHV